MNNRAKVTISGGAQTRETARRPTSNGANCSGALNRGYAFHTTAFTDAGSKEVNMRPNSPLSAGGDALDTSRFRENSLYTWES